MSLFTRRPQPVEERAHGLPSWMGGWVPPTASGQEVTADTALRNAAVSACQRVLVASAASLPVEALRRQGRRRTNMDPQPQVVRKPSARVSRRNWVAQVMRGLVRDGNAYLQVVAVDPRSGYPTQVEVLPPSAISWYPVDGTETLHINGRPQRLWPEGDIVHVPASAFIQPGGTYAPSPTDLAREAIGSGLAAERYGAAFFGGGGHPSAIITSNQALDADQAQAIKRSFLTSVRGQEPAVFGSGLDYRPIQINPDDTQFIALMQFEVENVCRFYGVPTSMVYGAISGQAVTYSNATQADMQFLKYSLGIWLADVEDMWTSMLPRPIDVRFNVDGLLRMDPATRWQVHETATRIKARTVNEVREYEDEDPFDDPAYDQPGVPAEPAQQLTLPV